VTKNELLFSSISDIGSLYRSGSISPVEIARLTVEEIEVLNPKLNAFITVTVESALESARRAESELRAGKDRGVLHGIPVALKDLVETAGIRTTAGSRILANNIPNRDAEVVRRLKEAGAVIVGKTNMLEFGYGPPHPDFGSTRNPWDTSRTASGSSGGSAAATAAGLCYAAVGTDSTGSIRIPAAYCGVAGLKPTSGLVSLKGIIPLTWSLDTVGPMARTSEDAGLLLGILAEGQPPLKPIPLKGLRLGVLTEQINVPGMQSDVVDAFDRACTCLSKEGAIIEHVSIPELNVIDGAIMSIIAPEASLVHYQWIKERPGDYAPLTRQQIELGFAIPSVVYLRMQQFRHHLAVRFMEILRQTDAILSPTAPWVATKEDSCFVSVGADFDQLEVGLDRQATPYNLVGMPALSIPCGTNSEGLPIGLQIATRPGSDSLALSIGAAFEGLAAMSHVAHGSHAISKAGL
jgi:aspartyl-tRNA(Asn)/glutamyl-tRNA(Gln) amidotransferase subunit A